MPYAFFINVTFQQSARWILPGTVHIVRDSSQSARKTDLTWFWDQSCLGVLFWIWQYAKMHVLCLYRYDVFPIIHVLSYTRSSVMVIIFVQAWFWKTRIAFLYVYTGCDAFLISVLLILQLLRVRDKLSTLTIAYHITHDSWSFLSMGWFYLANDMTDKSVPKSSLIRRCIFK
jgi:hypothetical protein